MRPLRLIEAERDPETRAKGDPVESWLGVLRPLLSGPEREREGVLDELRDHLTQRVRDLMVNGGLGGVRGGGGGGGESDAIGIALSELGDAAAFARQWSLARSKPRRRLIMGITAGLGVVAAAMGITAISLLPARAGTTAGLDEGHPVPVAVFQPAGLGANAGETLVKLRVSGQAGDTWEQFLRDVGEAATMPVTISWAELGTLREPEPTTQLGVTFREITLSSALRLLNQARGLGEFGGVAVRVIDGSLVFTTAASFDKAESILVTYDLTEMPDIEVRGEAGTQEQIKAAIQTLVESENWASNGGDRATLAEVGNKLFIKAPPRMHKQVEWVLAEIKSTGKPRASAILTPVANPLLSPHGSPLGSPHRSPPGLGNGLSIVLFPDHVPGERTYGLSTMRGDEFRDVLALYFDTAPGLSRCDFTRVWEPDGPSLTLKASLRQVDLGERLRVLIDRPANTADKTPGDGKSFSLKHADATKVAEFLNLVFNTSPYLKNCPIPRSIAIEPSRNAVIFGSTSEQVDVVARLIELVDQPAPDSAAVPAPIGQNMGAGGVVTWQHPALGAAGGGER